MRQVAGAGVILAVAIAAVRFAGGPSGSPSGETGKNEGPNKVTASRKGPPAKGGSPYQGGCTVFDPEKKDPKYPKDANLGVAKAVIDRFFGIKDDPGRSPLKAMSQVRYAIALAPDPRHTNLSLMFDREMVAIQQSAQDEGYTYNSSWMPWKAESAAFPLYADAERADDETDQREACPGILLFRKSANGIKLVPNPDKTALKDRPTVPAADPQDPYAESLVVLVVGEQPTGGLNENQWANAVAWMNANASLTEDPPTQSLGKDGNVVSNANRTLYLLGPTFSGSLVSLERDLAALKAQPSPFTADTGFFPSFSTPVRILSGSISSCSSVRWFQQRSAETRPTTTLFGSFHENDDLHIYRLLNYLDQQGTDPKDVAILSEDETAYAAAPVAAAAPLDHPVGPKAKPQSSSADQTPPAACEFPYDRALSPVRFSYPRDISAVRAAYEKEAVFAAGSTRSVHPILQESDTLVEEASSASDTIHAYGGAITPIAQEAVLYGLVSHLRSHHSRYLILRCTNPLDFLFLTRFFHRAYPEGRIVTVGSDLLFRREIDSTEFRGVLALSNYPLLPRDQHWAAVSSPSDPNAPYPPHTHRIPDSHLEGIYLAGRYLFGTDSDWPLPPADPTKPLTLSFKANLPDFADPFWMHKPDVNLDAIQAPTWLSVVGRDGYWPLAVLNDKLKSTPQRCLDNADKLHDRKDPRNCEDQQHLPPPATLVQISGNVPDSGKPDAKINVYYDRDPKDPTRFYSTLPLKMHLAWQICAVCAAFLLLYQVFGVWMGPDHTASGLFALFRPVSAPSQSILLGINCALAASVLYELLTLGTALPAFDKTFGPVYSLFLYPIVSTIFLIVIYVLLRGFIPSARSRLVAIIVIVSHLLWQLLIKFGGINLTSFSVVFSGTDNFSFFIPCWLLLIAAIFWRLAIDFKLKNRVAAMSFALTLAVAGSVLAASIHARLGLSNALPLFYRISHLTSGVSPMVPLLFLIAGFYLWTWQAMAGNVLLCCGRPLLPEIQSPDLPTGNGPLFRYWVAGWYHKVLGLPVGVVQPAPNAVLPNARYRISHEIGRRIVKIASPLYIGLEIIILPVGLCAGAVVYLRSMGPPLYSLEGLTYDYTINITLLFAFLITIAEAVRLFFTWKELQRMLQALNRLRLRRTFSRLRAIESSTLWSVSGNVGRVQYQFFAQQFEAAKRLARLSGRSLPLVLRARDFGNSFAEASAPRIATGALWDELLTVTGAPSARIRQVFNDAVAEVLNKLFKHWDTEKNSLNLEGLPPAKSGDKFSEGEAEHASVDVELSPDPFVRAAEEFVCFHYIAFIQNILARMRTMVLSMIFLFVSVCLAISFYPFVPRTGIGMWMLVNLALIAAVVIYVYAGMERDATLSYITNTSPGSLGAEFYIKTATFLAGPVIGLLTTQFPSISESFLSFLQPGLDALK